ncbi:MAG: hypothetical protein CVV30_09665 [Methanomicrobiales archaeon HGW-Methanomicrobiales-1]|nr:MAG: hypothetical protein CVV30_09665 [Methanomicrobiales archaeon HGW-Methanomicrobiales-1]
MITRVMGVWDHQIEKKACFENSFFITDRHFVNFLHFSYVHVDEGMIFFCISGIFFLKRLLSFLKNSKNFGIFQTSQNRYSTKTFI